MLTEPPSDAEPRSARGRILFAAATAVLAITCYFAYFSGTDFAQDCYVWLCFAKFDRATGSLLWRNSLAGQFFRPVGQYWWLFVHALGGDHVLPYQLALLANHSLNAILAGLLARRLVGTGRIVFLLFILNPLFVAPVSLYFHYNFDLIGDTFFLTALLLLSVACRSGGRWQGGLSLIAAVAAYFSKEAYFTLPAVAVLVVGIPAQGRCWSLRQVRAHWAWLASHAAVAAAALAWRFAVIGGFGGYGLAKVYDLGSLAEHLAERATALAGFAGWSLLPICQRWTSAEFLPLIISMLLLAALTWQARAAAIGPGPLWCWAWIGMTWLPSLTMTTYAPVSFYPALPGSLLLLMQVLRPLRFRTSLAMILAATFAVHGALSYRSRTASIKDLRRQQAALRTLYPPKSWVSRPPQCVVLLDGAHDLLPDALIKYEASPGTSMSRALFFNAEAPMNWVITDPEPGDLRPLVISGEFQDGSMEMPPYRACPLVMDPEASSSLRYPRDLTALHWDGERFEDVTPPRAPAQRAVPD